MPEYPNHKIVLFDDPPEILSQPHSLTTSAKLWYHFDTDAQIGADLMVEKGGVEEGRATNIARWLQSAISEPKEWTDIGNIYCTPDWHNHNVGMFIEKKNPGYVCLLLPNTYQHPLMNFIRRGSGGYVWQAIQISALDDEEMFRGYCTEYFGIFQPDDQKQFRDAISIFLDAQG